LTVSAVRRAVDRAGLGPIEEKVVGGERLSFDDGVSLSRCPDVNVVGYLANLVREERHGNVAYHVRNRHINYTNICKNRCKFCCFWCAPEDPRGYVLSPKNVSEILGEGGADLREVHIVGGVNPDLTYGYYLDILRVVKQCCPNATIKAFTMVELDQICRVSGKSIPDTLAELRACGLDCVPGGGAEVFSERIHRELFPRKLSADGWLEMARHCHRAGLKSNATMLYGHIETEEERLRHLIRLRELQDETGGLQAFIPLAFHPGESGVTSARETPGSLDLRIISLSRLLLDNVSHIKAYWVMITPRLAQVALFYGADDLDGTIGGEQITHDAGAATPRDLPPEELIALIREAGRIPVERDGLYNKVSSETPSPSGRGPG
jgi:aminodeoxyfutalosine synthase